MNITNCTTLDPDLFIQYGLYTAFMGPFLYIIFGTAKEVSIGPTAIMSLMTQTYVIKGGPAYAILLGFLSGCVELAAGLLNLGKFNHFHLG